MPLIATVALPPATGGNQTQCAAMPGRDGVRQRGAFGTDERADSKQRRRNMFNRLAKIVFAVAALATVGLTLSLEAQAGGRACYKSGNYFVCR
jgi:hypothetical protein